ncbi:MAG: protein kinase [Acidobacteria bacterium]|nr:protein kinase [Acidobacteriota bacterium]
MIGTRIGNYEITSELAQGGMGAVYRGRHINLPREVVVKSILLSSFPPSAREHLKARFVREAYIQSQFDHPNIVRVYEFFTTDENYYLVMEFIDGMSLRDLGKRRGAIDAAHAVPLFKQALAALDYAHHFGFVDESGRQLKGIIHRDIKPANMMLDGKGRLKITDFGIVKLAGESTMTRTGFNPGTVDYMSPEQIRGLEIDARSDLYSLGVTFYEMLAGRLPFLPSETGSEYEVLKGHMELAPPPLSGIKAGIPEGLAAQVMRALAKRPEDRFQSAGEWLDAMLEGEARGFASTGAARQAMQPPTELFDKAATTPATTPMPQASNPTEVYVPAGVTMQAPTARSSPSRFAFIASGGVLLAAVTVAGIIFVPQSEEPMPQAATAPRAADPVTSAPPVMEEARENAALKAARDAEQEERYPAAIRLFEEYMRANPEAPDYPAVRNHVADLKKFNGLLAIAKTFMEKGDYVEARKDYAEALRLRPDSKLARDGLAAAEAALKPRS